MIDLFVKSLGRLLCETSYKGVIFVSVDALERGRAHFKEMAIVAKAVSFVV